MTIREQTDAATELAATFQGHLMYPGDEQYDEARRVWNGMIDRRPALIARCTTVDDVVAVVGFARTHHLLIAVRGGGHNVAGHATCDDGIVIDLSPMRAVMVDPRTRTVEAEGGATLADLDAVTQQYGLAVPMGVVSETGIAGLTLGGGMGWLRNKHGLSCDNLIAAEIVTAAGAVIRASATEHPDLLWGLRGGGGNFGIVTRFVYQAHPVGPEVAFAFVFHNGGGERMKQAIQFYRDFSATAPDDVSTLLFCGVVPPWSHVFAEEAHGQPFVAFAGMYAGPATEGQVVLQPLRDFSTPLADFSEIMPYVEAQKALDEEYPKGRRYYWKSLNLTRLDDAAIDQIVAHARRMPSALSTIDLWHIGGAVARTSSETSAFYGRQAAFLLSPEANWERAADDAANIGWLRALIADMEPFSDGSRYLNFAGFQEEGDALMQYSFGPQYRRLAALKQQYDPENVFRLNQNIPPATADA